MARSSQADKKKSVLIVEDSVDFANLLQFLAEDDGLGASQFPLDGDIVDWCKKNEPSVVLMDLALRKKGGLVYIKELKSDPDTDKIPIIIITGRDLSQKEVLDFQNQNIKYLRKGRVEINDIKKEIRDSLGLSGNGPAT